MVSAVFWFEIRAIDLLPTDSAAFWLEIRPIDQLLADSAVFWLECRPSRCFVIVFDSLKCRDSFLTLPHIKVGRAVAVLRG